MRSFVEFREAVLRDVTASVRDSNGTPPPLFIIEEGEQLSYVGPIFKSLEDKDNAPERMQRFVRTVRPLRLAVVMEAFSVDRPSEDERRQPVKDNPRAVHIVSVWFFRRGSAETEDWSAPVVIGKDDRVSLGTWSAPDYVGKVKNGFLWDPVAETMAERTDEPPAPARH